MKRVLLTGAGGAIGVHMLAKLLRDTDWHIVATDSFRHKGYLDRITTMLGGNNEWRERITLLIHDLTVPFTSRNIRTIGKADYIINLASLSDVQDSINNPAPFITGNVALMLTMLELAREIKPDVFVQFSTDEVYGPAEKDSAGHAEWDVIVPSNPYAASKAAQEAIAISYWRSYGVPLIITNTMNNFGEMQGASKFPAKIQSALEHGKPVSIHCAADGQIGTRYYLHSENTADALLYILRHCPPVLHTPGHIDRPERYNIVGNKQVSNLELAQTIAALMGKPLETTLVNFHDTNPGHDLHYGLSGKKLAEKGWAAPLGFEESLRRTIRWQQENPEWIAEEKEIS